MTTAQRREEILALLNQADAPSPPRTRPRGLGAAAR